LKKKKFLGRGEAYDVKGGLFKVEARGGVILFENQKNRRGG